MNHLHPRGRPLHHGVPRPEPVEPRLPAPPRRPRSRRSRARRSPSSRDDRASRRKPVGGSNTRSSDRRASMCAGCRSRRQFLVTSAPSAGEPSGASILRKPSAGATATAALGASRPRVLATAARGPTIIATPPRRRRRTWGGFDEASPRTEGREAADGRHGLLHEVPREARVRGLARHPEERPAGAAGHVPVCGTKLTKILGMDAAKAMGWSALSRRRLPAASNQLSRTDELLGTDHDGSRRPFRWRAARSATVVSSKTSCTARATSAQNPCSPQRESGSTCGRTARGRTPDTSDPRSRPRPAPSVIWRRPAPGGTPRPPPGSSPPDRPSKSARAAAPGTGAGSAGAPRSHAPARARLRSAALDELDHRSHRVLELLRRP